MLLAVLGYSSFTQERMYWDMWVTLLELGLFSQGTLWNLGSRDQAGLELGWPGWPLEPMLAPSKP